MKISRENRWATVILLATYWAARFRSREAFFRALRASRCFSFLGILNFKINLLFEILNKN